MRDASEKTPEEIKMLEAAKALEREKADEVAQANALADSETVRDVNEAEMKAWREAVFQDPNA